MSPCVRFIRVFPLAKWHEQAKTLRKVEGERQGRVALGSSGSVGGLGRAQHLLPPSRGN